MRALPLAVVVLLCACPRSAPSSATPASGPSTAPATQPVPDIRAACAAELARELACEADFVPMIVDTRIRLDVPPGTAARAAESNGRNKLIEEARLEFAEDYAPERVGRICERRQQQLAEHPEAMPQLGSAAGSCTTSADCKAFTACMAPILEQLLRLGISGT